MRTDLRWMAALPALVLALCVPALGQNGGGDAPPKLPENKRKGKIEFELPSKSEAKKDTPSTPADQVKAALPAFAKYPGLEAQEAIERLSLYGMEISEPLRGVVKGQDVRPRAAAAQLLARIGDVDAVPLLEAAIRDPKGRKQARVLFDALAELAPDTAETLAFEFAVSSVAALRAVGLTYLRDHANASHAERLRGLLASEYETTRDHAFQMLEKLGDPALAGDAWRLLGDGTSRLSERALHLIVENRTPELTAKVSAKAFEDPPTRESCWALLTLAELEDRWGEELIRNDSVPLLAPRLDAKDPLTKLSAAIALAQLGFRSEDEAVVALTEEKVLPALVETFLGGQYFKDFTPLFTMARARIRKITGTDPSGDLSIWKDAWTGSGAGPRMRRDLPQSALADMAEVVVVHYRRTLMFGVGRDLDLRFAGAGLVGSTTEPEVAQGAIFLEPARMKELLAELEASGVFGHGRSRKAPGVEEKVAARVVRFVSGDRERVIATSSETDEAFAKVEAALARAESEQGWQRFFTGARKDFAEYYAREGAGFASCPDEETRERRYLTAMVDALPRLTAAGRRQAIAEFLRRPALLKHLDEPSLQLVLAGLIDETIPEGAVSLLAAAVAKKKDPALFAPTCGFLAHQYTESSRELVSMLVRELGTMEVALRDDRALVRLFAVEEGTRQGTLGAEPLLALLDDPDPRVRMAAITGLVHSNDAMAHARLFELARGSDKILARLALEALGGEASGEAFELLKTNATGEDAALALAAIRGLGQRSGADVVTVLADVLAKQGATTPIGAAALDSLATMRTDEGRNWLRSKLTGDDLALAEEAAYRLGARGDLAAVPVLLTVLDTPSRATRATEQLALILACDGGDRGEQFIQRFRDEPTVLPIEWFKRAIAHERDEPAGPRAIAGIALPRLIEALTDPRWYVRWNAARLLEGAFGVALGTPYRFAADEDVARIAQRWEGYLATRFEASAGS